MIQREAEKKHQRHFSLSTWPATSRPSRFTLTLAAPQCPAAIRTNLFPHFKMAASIAYDVPAWHRSTVAMPRRCLVPTTREASTSAIVQLRIGFHNLQCVGSKFGSGGCPRRGNWRHCFPRRGWSRSRRKCSCPRRIIHEQRHSNLRSRSTWPCRCDSRPRRAGSRCEHSS